MQNSIDRPLPRRYHSDESLNRSKEAAATLQQFLPQSMLFSFLRIGTADTALVSIVTRRGRPTSSDQVPTSPTRRRRGRDPFLSQPFSSVPPSCYGRITHIFRYSCLYMPMHLVLSFPLRRQAHNFRSIATRNSPCCFAIVTSLRSSRYRYDDLCGVWRRWEGCEFQPTPRPNPNSTLPTRFSASTNLESIFARGAFRALAAAPEAR